MERRNSIRNRIKKYNLSYVWLINQLAEVGIVTDKTEMSSVLANVRNGDKAETIVEQSMVILDKYERAFVHKDNAD